MLVCLFIWLSFFKRTLLVALDLIMCTRNKITVFFYLLFRTQANLVWQQPQHPGSSCKEHDPVVWGECYVLHTRSWNWKRMFKTIVFQLCPPSLIFSSTRFITNTQHPPSSLFISENICLKLRQAFSLPLIFSVGLTSCFLRRQQQSSRVYCLF